ncbi:MAG TPA: alpha/beta hydrolase [Burkholderiales bacterium]
MTRVLSALVTIAVVYGLILLFVYAMQDRLVYFPTRPLDATPRTIGLEYEDVAVTTEDGPRLHGWFIPAPGARGTVLHFHGNGGNISHRLDYVEMFHRLEINTLLIDYRGYGQSEGQPSEQGTYRDALAAWRYLTEARGLAPDTIILHGESLGGAVASWLAARTAPRALIVESSFTSAVDLGAEVYSWLPVRWIARYRYPTLSHLAQVRVPVLIVHSRNDEIIPFHHGQQLYAAAPTPKQFIETSGGHNDGLRARGAKYLSGIEMFLRATH